MCDVTVQHNIYIYIYTIDGYGVGPKAEETSQLPNDSNIWVSHPLKTYFLDFKHYHHNIIHLVADPLYMI